MKDIITNYFTNIPTLQTERLILRKITPLDIDDVFEYAKDPSVSSFLLWRPHKNREFTRIYLSVLDEKYDKGQFYDWGVEYNGKMIGTVGFSQIDLNNNTAEIGYVLNSSYWGVGLATEAAKAIIKIGFETFGFDKIYAKCIWGHKSSINVMNKCIMSKEAYTETIFSKGKLKKIYVASIIKDFYLEHKDLFN